MDHFGFGIDYHTEVDFDLLEVNWDKFVDLNCFVNWDNLVVDLIALSFK